MANGIQKRTRSERVAAVELPPGVIGRTLGYLRQGPILVRLGLCLVAALVLWAVTQAWSPPLTYYEGYVPTRDIHASIAFDQPDPEATREAKREAGDLAFAVYSNDDEQLVQLRARLMNTVNKVLGAESVEAVGTDEWSQFMPPQAAAVEKTAPGQPAREKATPPEKSTLLERRVPKRWASKDWVPGKRETTLIKISRVPTRFVSERNSSSDTGSDQTPSEIAQEPHSEKTLPPIVAQKTGSEIIGTPEDRDTSSQTGSSEKLRPSKEPEETDKEVGSSLAVAEKTSQEVGKEKETTSEPKDQTGENTPNQEKVNENPGKENSGKENSNNNGPKPAEKPPGKPKKEPPQKLDPATQRFLEFKAALAEPGAVEALQASLEKAFQPLEQHGILEKLPNEHTGNQERILVYPQGHPGLTEPVSIRDILAPSASSMLQQRIKQTIQPKVVAESIAIWLKDQLPNTLDLDPVATKNNRETKQNEVPEQQKHFAMGTILAIAGQPIDETQLALLQKEHEQLLGERSLADKAGRSLAAMGMYLALYTLCGFYIYRSERELLTSLPRLCTLLCLVVGTITLATILKGWRAELVPLLLFSMAIAIAYHQELALLLAAAVMLILVTALGRDLSTGIILLAATSGAILLLRNVRTRTKLLFVGLGSGSVALLTTLGMGKLMGQPWSELIQSGLLSFGLCVLAGSLMTVLLPFIERAFGVLTDISLLELGDAANPLLQELIRRAPGTYNHSITVALLSEAAAEAIGARGLLVRVGAFFHDIGKMLKPGYFIENQGQGDNRHESLVPAMSTLVIIAHVKDGADLARQNRLPETIIDFIQQHHGTTLVEYFYRRANEQKEAGEEGGEVDESSFRYPGPKPQSKEAGVLMLADAVESASRVLVEPTPARIESLVEEITMKRLLDGQFDECGLTLQEVHLIGESLVKSLTGVYHGRVKYPGQQTA